MKYPVRDKVPAFGDDCRIKDEDVDEDAALPIAVAVCLIRMEGQALEVPRRRSAR
ncbi:hypothetical protein [Streptomyces sp. NPDC097981]|uniref:hypothetical protein n=1 Tax=Streptomyces sp. NPDC097981 TaxID=3155428 RepID=UPI00331C8062